MANPGLKVATLEETAASDRKLGYTEFRNDGVLGVPLELVLNDVIKYDSRVEDFNVNFCNMQCIERNDVNKVAIELALSQDVVREFVPAKSFWSGFVRYAARYTNVAGLSMTLLRSLQYGTHPFPGTLTALVNDLLGVMCSRYSDPVMVRTVRGGDGTSVGPACDTCRALLHDGYRDDIGHVWLVKSLQELTTTGTVRHYRFDGDLLLGLLLVSEFARLESKQKFTAGISFFSGEVGNRKCGVIPGLCSPFGFPVLFGEPHQYVHAGKFDHDEATTNMKKYVDSCIPMVNTFISRYSKLDDITFGNIPFAKMVVVAGQDLGLTQTEVRAWTEGVKEVYDASKPLTAMTIHNGLRRLFEVCNVSRQLDLSLLAGRAAQLDWDAIADDAFYVTDDAVEQVTE